MLNPWKRPRLARGITRLSTELRRKRVSAFLRVMQPGPQDLVLDVGTLPRRRGEGQLGAVNPLLQHYPWPDRLLAVGIETEWDLPMPIPYVAGDGCCLPFRDNAVDFVFSNAVIEHVGGPERAGLFLRECQRVARKGIWISTPNRWFPLEIHTFLPIVHWLPLRIYWWLAGRLYHHHFSSPLTHWPLGQGDLRAVLPPGCRISGSGGWWPMQLIVWGRKTRPTSEPKPCTSQ